MPLAYYVTAHGYGHAVRAGAVMEKLPPAVPLLIRSAVPDWFFAQEVRRPYFLHPQAFDCGVLQADALTVLPRPTLEAYAEIHARNQASVEAEIDWLRQQEVKLVVSDIPSFPVYAARQIGIETVVIANFTWSGIYHPYVDQFPDFAPLIDAMRREYASASLLCRLALSLPMPEFPRQCRYGLLCRPRQSIRAELAREYRLDPSQRWVLMYWGHGDLDFAPDQWRGTRDTCFLTLQAGENPFGAVSIDPGRFPGQNVVASCDVVVAKLGYGIVVDCMAGDTPLLYTARPGFVEASALEAGLHRWGRAIRVEREDLVPHRLAQAMEAVLRRPLRMRIRADAADRIAERLLAMYHAAG